jgi:DNA invertase Pin-like site-specific DNA recombinase
MQAALYLRQSRDFTGEEHGVTRQREDSEALAKRRGWTVSVIHTDNDTSAAGKKRRPGFEALMTDIESGRITAVIAWSLDRLTRNARDRLRLLEVGKERGLILALVRGSDLDLSTPAGRLTADILGSVAQHEIDQKADRQRRAALQRSEMGKPPSGVRLTGYTPSGEVVEAEAIYIRQLFTRFAEGDSLRALAAWLREGGVPTRHGGPWHPSSVRSILLNPRYAGRAIYQGRTTGNPGNWEPMTDSATFDLVQARLADPRRKTQNGTDRRHLGSGLYLCATCEIPVRAWTGHRYSCPNGCFTRAQHNIDDLVTQLIYKRLSMPDLAELLPHEADESTQQLLEELAELRARVKTIAADYDAGLIDGQRYAIATDKARSQMATLQASLTRASNQGVQLLHADNPAEAFANAPLMLQRATLNALCEVKLHPVRRGPTRFDARSVEVVWRRGGSTEAPAPAQA